MRVVEIFDVYRDTVEKRGPASADAHATSENRRLLGGSHRFDDGERAARSVLAGACRRKCDCIDEHLLADRSGFGRDFLQSRSYSERDQLAGDVAGNGSGSHTAATA